jgi:hypothetical protein
MEIDKQIYSRPAILLGNGLNNYRNSQTGWERLLIEISENTIPEDVFDDRGISYPEIFDAICFNNGKESINYSSLKEKICKIIVDWPATEYHKTFVDFAGRNNIPVLTTNYDLILETSIKNGKLIQPNKLPGEAKRTDYYPWHSYYSDHEVKNVLNEFAVWHIHGFQHYKRSLVIGAIDYTNVITRLKRYVPTKIVSANDEWIGSDSWIAIFFHCDLIIIGLSLDPQETSLRWLFMERERYFRRNEEKRKKTLYVCNRKYDKFKEGKKYFFESINIKLQWYDCPSDIYERWSML